MPDSIDQSASSCQCQETLHNMALALGCVDEAIVWTDRNGRVQWCNAAFERLVDQTAAALVEQHLTELLPLTLNGEPLLLHPASWSLANKQRCEGDYSFQRHDRSFLLALTVTPLSRSNHSTDASDDSSGNGTATQGVMLVIRDITMQTLQRRSLPAARLEREDAICTHPAELSFQDISNRSSEIERQCTDTALRESEQRFRNIFDTTAVGTAITALDGAFLQANAAYCQTVGYTEAELLTRTFQQLTHPDDLAQDLEGNQKLLAGELACFHFEKRYLHKQGTTVWGLLSVSVVRDEAQQPLYCVAQMQNITARKQAEAALHQLNQELEQRVQRRTAQLEAANQQLQAAIAGHEQTEAALRESEERFRLIFNHAPIAISLADAHTCRLIKVNQAHQALFGYSPAELATMTFVDFTHPDDADQDVDRVNQLLNGSISRFQIEKRFVKKNGDWLWANLTVALVRDPSGEVYSMGMMEDITTRKQTEAALQLTQFSIDRSTDPIWWVQSDGTISYVNDSACRELGYERDAIVGQRVSTFNPDFHDDNWSAHWQEMKQRRAFTFETRHRAKNGVIFPVEVTVNYLELDGNEYHCSIVRNITDRKRSEAERKQAEDKLKASLKEKEILLKEIHHRVKNNLQTVYSLLNLQANAIQDPQILSPFKDSQHRIKAMALIHEKLYQTERLAKINFDDYVQHLVADLIRSYSTNPEKIHVQIELANLELAVDVVLPCGFIINELISNALKYAFPGDRSGTIQICFSVSTIDHCHLIIADSGVGIPESIALFRDASLSNTLGLQLVQAFVQQLRGTITLDRSGGSRFEIVFPNPA